MNYVTRLAPTPSGYLHVGNAWSFFCTLKIAAYYEARLHLRIDDFDSQRMREEYIEDIYDSLEWLGITDYSGPRNLQEYYRGSPSEKILKTSQEILTKHQADKSPGRKMYPCSCSRKNIRDWYELNGEEARGYPAICRNRFDLDGLNMPWRFDVSGIKTIVYNELENKKEFEFHKNSDFLICNKEAVPSYQLQSIVYDDSLDVNLVVRGEDLLESTAYQMALVRELGVWNKRPIKFWHHPLVADEKGNKLSKSQGAVSLLHWRKKGIKSSLLREYFEELFQKINPWSQEFERKSPKLVIKFADFLKLI